MASRRNARWIGAALLVLTGVSPILVGVYDVIFHSGLAANTRVPVASGLGISLIVVGILLPVLGIRYRDYSQHFDKIQDWIFAILLILVGVVLFVYGGVFEYRIVLVLAQWILVESTVYWIVKDIFKQTR